MDKNELMLLLSTWFFWYKTWQTDDMLEEIYYDYLDNRTEDILQLAVCLHKFYMTNDQFVEALACGQADTFLAFVPDHMAECFASQEEYEKEKAKLIRVLYGLREITFPIQHYYVYDHEGNQVLS